MKKTLLTLSAVAMLAAGANAQVYLNEILINPPGTDGVNSYVEIRGTAGASLSGTYLITLEGDSASNLGTIDFIFNLSSFSIGSNGFLAAVVTGHPYTIAGGTTVATSLGDPENLSNTYMLINIGVGAAPILAQDLDSGDNGLDALPSGWSILDSIGFLDGGSSDRSYGAITFSQDADGLTEAGSTFVNAGFSEIEYAARLGNSTGSTAADWMVADLGGTAPGFTINAGENSIPSVFDGDVATSHLGAVNPIPEPTTLAALLGGLGLMGMLRRRRA